MQPVHVAGNHGELMRERWTGRDPSPRERRRWKLLGVAVLLPGFALLKEWAYAGMIVDLTGAAASQAAGGGDVRHILVRLALEAVVVAS